MHLGLIACGAKKSTIREMAKNLYMGELFKKSRAYVESNCYMWGILSAKHGLLLPDDWTDPYDCTLNDMRKAQRKEWAYMVLGQIKIRIPATTRVTMLAGAAYREPLETMLAELMPTSAPLGGLGIGQQLAWLKAANEGRT